MDVDALATAASQMQASLASLAKAKGKGKGGSKGGQGKGKNQDGGKANDKGKQKGKGVSWSNSNSWNKSGWYKNDWNKGSWHNQNSKGKGKGCKGKDSNGTGKGKSKKVATVETFETSGAHTHQPEPEYPAARWRSPHQLPREQPRPKPRLKSRRCQRAQGLAQAARDCGCWIVVLNQAMKESTQSSRELYEKKSEMAIDEAEAQGKAGKQAVLDRQEEMKQLQEQFAKKEQASKTLLQEANLQLRRFTADLASGMVPRLAKKKGKSCQRAEQHRVASAQPAQRRLESWRDSPASRPNKSLEASPRQEGMKA